MQGCLFATFAAALFTYVLFALMPHNVLYTIPSRLKAFMLSWQGNIIPTPHDHKPPLVLGVNISPLFLSHYSISLKKHKSIKLGLQMLGEPGGYRRLLLL